VIAAAAVAIGKQPIANLFQKWRGHNL
jgi:hypothetical protein